MLKLPEASDLVIYIFGILILSATITLFLLLLRKVTKKGSKMGSGVIPRDFIEDEAYGKALRILDEARLKSLKIIAESETFDEETKKQLQDRLEEISQRQLHSLSDVSNKLLSTYTSVLDKEVNDFTSNLHESTVENQQRVDSQIRTEYAQIKQELQEYKRHRVEQIDRAMYRILAEVMSSYFGKVLPMKEHEELVIGLLEDAKSRTKFEV